jgi:hypothetical protein
MVSEQMRDVNKKPTLVRIYRNNTSGTELAMHALHVDAGGNKWWAFEDLFSIPFIRQMAAKKVVDLYGHGLALSDITGYTAQLKDLLRGNQPDKYERCFAKVLEIENLATSMADPVKQCLGMCTVYLCLNDERPDSYANHVQAQKMELLAADIDSQSFFLSWWIEVMRRSGKVLNSISGIASMINL